MAQITYDPKKAYMYIGQDLSREQKKQRRKEIKAIKSKLINMFGTVRKVKYQKPTKRRTECVWIYCAKKRVIIIPIQSAPTHNLSNLIMMSCLRSERRYKEDTTT